MARRAIGLVVLTVLPAAAQMRPVDRAQSIRGLSAPSALSGVKSLGTPPQGLDSSPTDVMSPEQFALRAESLFTAGRLAAGQRAAVVYRDEASAVEVIPTGKELRERLAQSSLTNAQREAAVVELFKLAGASEFEIDLQDVGLGQHNIVVAKKGRGGRVIVVGGHYDKLTDGAGVVDNWTGAALVANLYHELRRQETDATYVFIAFAGTQDGLLGSQAYIDSLTGAQKKAIDAMINLDVVGVNGTFSWNESAARPLLARAEEAARQSRRELKEGTRVLIADSTSFRRAGIPALTIFGATQDLIYEVVHSGSGRNAAFSVRQYKNAFALVCELLKSLDRRGLGLFGRWQA